MDRLACGARAAAAVDKSGARSCAARKRSGDWRARRSPAPAASWCPSSFFFFETLSVFLAKKKKKKGKRGEKKRAQVGFQDEEEFRFRSAGGLSMVPERTGRYGPVGALMKPVTGFAWAREMDSVQWPVGYVTTVSLILGFMKKK